MRSGIFAVLFGSSALIAVSALAQPKAGPAELCHELLAFAEMKAAEPPATPAGQATGTQGGSVSPSSSTNMRSQAAAPPTVPVSLAPLEAAVSSHASGSWHGGAGATPAGTPATEFKLAGGTALQQVRDTAKGGDRQACRETVQNLRRAGADLPAALIALAAYEPDPAKRQ